VEVQSKPRALPAAECRTPWVFQLLRSPWERSQPASVLPQHHADFPAVAQPAEPTPQLHVARLHSGPGALQSGPPTDRWTTQDEPGNPHAVSRPATASLAEEPGARKPHAGLWAGAVGSLAVLPRWLRLLLSWRKKSMFWVACCCSSRQPRRCRRMANSDVSSRWRPSCSRAARIASLSVWVYAHFIVVL
jgi:hypothetical protein